MRIILGCEESQEVCKAFRAKDTRPLAAISNPAQGVTPNGIYRVMYWSNLTKVGI